MKPGKPSDKAAEHGKSAGDCKPTLPPWRAFVVQFSRETSTVDGVFSGRVEHLNSACRSRFGSREELLAALAKMLAEFGDG